METVNLPQAVAESCWLLLEMLVQVANPKGCLYTDCQPVQNLIICSVIMSFWNNISYELHVPYTFEAQEEETYSCSFTGAEQCMLSQWHASSVPPVICWKVGFSSAKCILKYLGHRESISSPYFCSLLPFANNLLIMRREQKMLLNRWSIEIEARIYRDTSLYYFIIYLKYSCVSFYKDNWRFFFSYNQKAQTNEKFFDHSQLSGLQQKHNLWLKIT